MRHSWSKIAGIGSFLGCIIVPAAAEAVPVGVTPWISETATSASVNISNGGATVSDDDSGADDNGIGILAPLSIASSASVTQNGTNSVEATAEGSWSSGDSGHVELGRSVFTFDDGFDSGSRSGRSRFDYEFYTDAATSLLIDYSLTKSGSGGPGFNVCFERFRGGQFGGVPGSVIGGSPRQQECVSDTGTGLVTLNIPDPFSGYSGSDPNGRRNGLRIELTGASVGAIGNSAHDLLLSADFSIGTPSTQTVPGPAGIATLATGMTVLLGMRLKRTRGPHVSQ